MKFLGYFAFIAILILLMLIIIPNSPLYSPLIDYIQYRAEMRWGVEIVKKSANVNVLRGTIVLGDLHLKTPETSNPAWELSIEKSIIEISHTSLMDASIVFDNVILNDVKFLQVTKAGPSGESARALGELKKKGAPFPAKTQANKGKKRSKESARIKRLVIRNGSFEFNIQSDSGIKESVKAENVNLVRKDVVLSQNLNDFFRSILGGANPILR